jgi:predicted nucleic acid-binding protein
MNAFAEADQKLDQFLAAFNRNRVNITLPLMRRASAFAAQYNLNSHDALMIAILRDLGASRIWLPSIKTLAPSIL